MLARYKARRRGLVKPAPTTAGTRATYFSGP